MPACRVGSSCRYIGLIWIVFVVMLVGAETTSAEVVNVPLSDFVIFSGGGDAAPDADYETSIGGHTYIDGNIGSNQDLFLQGNPLPGYPAQLDGSAYAGGDLSFGQDLTVGSSVSAREVVVNGAASIGGGVTIYGTLDAYSYTLGSGAVVTGGVTAPSDRTFGLITMPTAASFTAGGVDQTVPSGGGSSLTLGPDTYGTLSTSAQDQTVYLSSGNYYFDAITAQGGFTLSIDLTSGARINIYVVGDAAFSQRNTLMVKGAGTGGVFVPINAAPSLASLVYLETHGNFGMSGGLTSVHNIWGGTVYSSLMEDVSIGQYTDWYGAVYSYDSFDVADHGNWNHVPLSEEPEPTGACCNEATGVCTITTQSDCAYSWLGPDVPCDATTCPAPAPMGACCLVDQGVCVVMTEADCVGQSGEYQGDDTDCDPNPCVIPSQACCFGPDCLVLPPAECLAEGGTVYAELVCDPNPCPPVIEMACCLEDGSCAAVQTAEECQAAGGSLYPDVTCSTPGFACPVPIAACCLDYDEQCHLLTEAECLAGGGEWHEGMDCDQVTCPPWRVCCIANDCFILTETDCTEQGGTWEPGQMGCEPNPCEAPVPVDPSSWGAIKSVYR